MKILLLGGTGFVGSYLSSALVDSGREVIVVSNNEPATPVESVDYYTVGADFPKLLNQLLPSCSHVVHLASSTTPSTSHRTPSLEVDGNITPLSHLLESLQKTPQTHLIFVSSGGAIYGDQPVEVVNERTVTSPISYYGAGKAAIEIFLRAYQAQTGHGVTVIRPSNLYGPGQSVKAGFGIVPTLFDCVLNKRPLELWGEGNAIRDYLYVSDFVDFCLNSISWSNDRDEFTLFNAGSETGYSIIELHDKVSTICGLKIDIVKHPPRGIDVKRIVLDSSEAKEALGWQPRTSLSQGLELTWQWLNAQKKA